MCVEKQSGDIDLGVASQEEIDWVGQLQNVKSVSIAIVDDNIDLIPIAGLKQLEELYITVNNYSKELDFSFLRELTHLKRLYLCEGNGEWNTLGCLKELEELEIVEAEIETLDFLQELTKLKDLSLSCVCDTDMDNLRNIKKLESIFLKGYDIRNIECLQEMKNIRSINLVEMKSDVHNGEGISTEIFSEMDKLKNLYLIRMDIKDLTPISVLANVEKIVLVENGLESIQCLNKLPRLKELLVYGECNERIKEEAEQYFSELEIIIVEDEIPDSYR